MSVIIAGGDTAQPINLQKRLDWIQTHISSELEKPRFLDCGCGRGDYIVALNKEGWDAQGVEFLEEKVKEAREAGIGEELLQQGDVEQLKQADEDFDALLFNEVLEHVPDDNQALREAFRVLRPGGQLFVFSPNRLYPFETHGVYRKGTDKLLPVWLPYIPYLPKKLGEKWFRYWARNYWPWKLRKQLVEAGFEIEVTSYFWQTFEGIANEGEGAASWLEGVRPVLRKISFTLEKIPLAQVFGVSQFIVARKPQS